MKFKPLLLQFFLLGAAPAGRAQVATVDSKKVFASMPVFARIDALVQAESQKYFQDYIKKKLSAQLLVTVADSLKRLPARGAVTAEAIRAAEAAIKELQAYETGANEKIAEYKEILLKPYIDRVNKAIKSTAQRMKYKQVLDVQQVPFAYTDGGSDITIAVIAVLADK